MKCPYCKKKIDLDKGKVKSQEIAEKVINKLADKIMEKRGIQSFEHIDYYCNCGAHITLVKGGKNWITASKN